MRAYRVYLLLSGVLAFGFSCAYTLNLVYQLRIVGMGPLELVLAGTTLEVVCLVAQVPTGIIADLYSRRLSIVVGIGLTGVGAAVEGLVPTFGAVLVATAIWGIGATCIDGALEAWVADEIGAEGIGTVLTRGAQVDQVATVLGIGAAAGLALITLNVPLLVGGAVMLALAGALALVMPENGFERGVGSGRPLAAMREQVVTGSRVVRGNPVLLCLLGATLFVGLGSEGFDRLGQAHLLDDVALPAITPIALLGLLSVAATLGSVVVTEVVRRRLLKPGRAAPVGAVVAFQAVGTLAMFGFALAGGFGLAALAWLLVSIMRSAGGPLRSAWLVAQTESSSRATIFSVAGMVDAAGQIAGGPPVGVIGQKVSVRAALSGAGFLTAPAVLLLTLALTRPTRPAPLAPAPAPLAPAP